MIDTNVLLLLIISVSCLIQLINYFCPFRKKTKRFTNPNTGVTSQIPFSVNPPEPAHLPRRYAKTKYYESSKERIETIGSLAQLFSLLEKIPSTVDRDKVKEYAKMELDLIKKAQENLQENKY